MKSYIATRSDKGKRLGEVVQRIFFPFESKKHVKRLIEQNSCFVNQKAERFASKKVAVGDHISISNLTPCQEKPFVLFEDEHICLLQKPSGIESDPVLLGFPDFYLVHRLDKPTSGVIILAKTETAKKGLETAFAEREVKKSYLAIADGIFPETNGTIENSYGRKKEYEGGSIWGSVDKGVYARTDFRVLSQEGNYTLLELSPITGRTHQIRSHLAEKGFPVVGDYQYGRELPRTLHIPHLMLHAYQIAFFHPISGKALHFKASLPNYFKEQIKTFSLSLENLL